MTKKQAKITNEKLESQIAGLKDKTSAELKELWHKHFDYKPAQYQREFMVRRIAYEMQAKVHGRLPKTAVNKLKRLANEDQKEVRVKHIVSPGTKLIRDWNGKRYEVIGLDDGKFEYAGKKYGSLSVIAKEITGSHWSGPLFFGLKKQTPAKKKVVNE